MSKADKHLGLMQVATAKRKSKIGMQEEGIGKEEVVGSCCSHMGCESVCICAEDVSFSRYLLSLLLLLIGCSLFWAAGLAVSAVVPKAASFKLWWAGKELLLKLFKATRFAFAETGWGMHEEWRWQIEKGGSSWHTQRP